MITKQTTVWCDGCSIWIQESIPVGMLRAKVKKLGWKCLKGEEARMDFCPECASLLRRGEVTPTGLVLPLLQGKVRKA